MENYDGEHCRIDSLKQTAEGQRKSGNQEIYIQIPFSL